MLEERLRLKKRNGNNSNMYTLHNGESLYCYTPYLFGDFYKNTEISSNTSKALFSFK